MLATTVSAILLQQGIETAEKEALGTLTELMQCFISELAFLSKNYCELSSRTEPLIADVILGFVEMGFNFRKLDQFVKRNKVSPLSNLQQQQQPKQVNMLQAGSKQALPNYILQCYPQFPDPHAYIRTPTHKQPVIDYEAIREKFAIQKKDIERALTKFLAKTSPIHNLFDNDDTNAFPLIATKPIFPAYLNALLPQDQIFDDDELEYKSEELNYPSRKKFKVEETILDNIATRSEKQFDGSIKTEENPAATLDIDNPYLAPTKLPSSKPLL